MQRLVITGSSGALGQRLVAQFAAPSAPAVTEIIAVDRFPLPTTAVRPHGLRTFVRDLSTGGSEGLVELFGSASVLIHLASEGGDGDGPSAEVDLSIAKRVFDAAGSAGVTHLVVVSSAVVYGAHSDNPVPLTETAPLRTNPDFSFAHGRVAMEQLGREWAAAAPGRTLSVLRPAVSPLAGGPSGWLAKAVRPTRLDQFIAPMPAMQFVHVGDVASAVLHAAVAELDGTFNVAPDGWLAGEDAPALFGTMVSIPATGRVHDVASALARLLQRGRPRPAGAGPWAVHPWVIANDRLKATGWAPRSTSAEVLVSSKSPSKIAILFARKRQEVTIAAVGLVGAGALGTVVLWLRSRRRYR